MLAVPCKKYHILPAVNQQWSLGGSVLGIYSVQEGQDGSSVLRDTMVWPVCEMKLDHFLHTAILL